MKTICLLLTFICVIASAAVAGSGKIEVLKVSETFSEEDGFHTKIRIGVTRNASKSYFEIQCPQAISKRTLANGKTRIDSFKNADDTILGFNFHGGAQINYIYLVILTEGGVVSLDHAEDDLAKELKLKGQDEIDPVTLFLDFIDYKNLGFSTCGSGSENSGIKFKARFSNGKLKIIDGSVKKIKPEPIRRKPSPRKRS